MEINSMRQFRELLTHYNCLGPGAELGVAEGRSSYDFLSMGIPTLFMVDIWESIDQKGDASSPQEWHDKNYLDAKERVKEFGERAIFLKGKTVEQAERIFDSQLDWIYIDAGHNYTNVYEDLTAWTPKVRIGGIISGHDFLNTAYGVFEAVHDFCKTYGYIVHTIPETDVINASFWFLKTH